MRSVGSHSGCAESENERPRLELAAFKQGFRARKVVPHHSVREGAEAK